MVFGKGRLRMVRTVLILILGLTGLVLFFLSFRPLFTPAVEEGALPLRGTTFFDGRYEGWEGTKLIWSLEAEEIFRTTDGRRISFQGINEIRFYQENGRELLVRADQAVLDLRRKILILDRVEGELNGGELLTDKMELNLDAKTIKCPQPLSLVKEELQLEAKQMEGNFQTEEYRFFGDLAVIQKDHRFWGGSFDYYAKEDRFEIQGSVEVELEL
jgi:LPS export ABC transporter protein LptC